MTTSLLIALIASALFSGSTLAATIPSTNSTASSGNQTLVAPAGFLRGVNLGGWLVLEKWMDGDAFSGAFASAKDQYTFDSRPGAAEALKKHWDTYLTEADIQTLAKTGINALRIPIGYWAYDTNATKPYLKGADVYMDKAIGWARAAGMKVWIDCHGSPGSQNGFDNSGRYGTIGWQTSNNMAHAIAVLEIMAARYGTMEYADVVVGLELTNEPVTKNKSTFSVTQSWAKDAYKAVKAKTANPNLVVVMHDAFQGATAWTGVAGELVTGGVKTFGIDSHKYQLFSDSDKKLTQAQHIQKACGWGANLRKAKDVMPTYVGEWSAATDICVHQNGTTTAGTKCTASGCQCESASMDKWNPQVIEQVRRYVEAQMDVFESSTSGYFIWSAKGPGGWGFLNGIANGAIPNPVTERKYPGQCSGGK
jgi:glucan 1,3-beta-glucosidase